MKLLKKSGLVSVVMLGFLLSGCGNQTFFDTEYTFHKAFVEWPDGSSETLEIDTWTDYSDGNQIQVTTKEGTTYLFHASKCVLISK